MNNEENFENENFEFFIVEDFIRKKELKNTLENFLVEIGKLNINYNFNNFPSSKFNQNETILNQILKNKNKIILNNNNSTTNINIINSNSSLGNENKNSKEKDDSKLKNSNENIEKDLKNSSNKLNNNNNNNNDNESENEKEKINENFDDVVRESTQFEKFKNDIQKNENNKFNVLSSNSDLEETIKNLNIEKEVENIENL